jgi:hypothetical protein
MTIWIVQNAHAQHVEADLRKICGGDPGLVVDSAGRVSYTQTVDSVGANAIAEITQQWIPVAVRIESPLFYIIAGYKLLFGGATLTDRARPTLHVESFYDVSGGLTGLGYYEYDANRNKIPVPTDVILFHELAHARLALAGQFDKVFVEADAVAFENSYRQSKGLPSRLGHYGGLYGDPDPDPRTVPAQDTVPVGPKPPWNRREVATRASGVVLLCLPLIGEDHVFPPGLLPPGQATYRVFVRNATPDTFTEIVVFFKRVGQSGVVFLREENVGPAEVRGFVLGIAALMESYVIGFFIGDDMVAQWPASGDGNMTPQRASIENPDDTDPTVDWWTIDPQ